MIFAFSCTGNGNAFKYCPTPGCSADKATGSKEGIAWAVMRRLGDFPSASLDPYGRQFKSWVSANRELHGVAETHIGGGRIKQVLPLFFKPLVFLSTNALRMCLCHESCRAHTHNRRITQPSTGRSEASPCPSYETIPSEAAQEAQSRWLCKGDGRSCMPQIRAHRAPRSSPRCRGPQKRGCGEAIHQHDRQVVDAFMQCVHASPRRTEE